MRAADPVALDKHRVMELSSYLDALEQECRARVSGCAEGITAEA